MIEKNPFAMEDHSILESLGSIEAIADTYYKEIKNQNPFQAQEIFEQANLRLAKTLEASRHVMDMIQHFRSLDSVNATPFFPPASCNSSVYDSVYQVMRAMQYEFPMEKITLLKIIPRDLLPPAITRGCLEVILFQLLYNARESVGDVAGIITIEAAEKTVLSTENQNPYRFMLRVSDTGPAIPEKFLSHIYDPFYTTQNVNRLNGVGLCVVKRLVERCHGTMRIETSLMGTSYFIEFSR